ncbi:MAG: D-2-hydroxyacid dehydrogenase [Anaerolineae bacterium]
MNRVKVLCTLRFTETQLDKLRAVSPRLVVEQVTCRTDEEVAQALDETVEVLYSGRANFPLEAAPNLKWVQLHSAGVDHVIGTPLWESDIPLTTTSGIHATPIAEYVFASILAFTCRVPRMLYYQKRHEWPRGRWNLFVGQELRGQTMGLVGYGSIGREVGRLARAFGMRVLATKRRAEERRDTDYELPATGDREGRVPDAVFPPGQLKDMLAQSDFVVIAVPLTPETEKLIGEAELRVMKPNAYLVNVARGPIVDEAALVRALRESWIAGAGLDVFEQEPLPPDSPLWDLDNVLLSPHVAGFTPYYDERATDLFAENLRRYLAGEPLLNLVDKARGY